MIDRPPVLVPVRVIRIDGAELGPGSAAVEDDALTLAAGGDDAPLRRLRLATIDRLHRTDALLELTLADGSIVALVCEQGDELADAVRRRTQTLPELTRTLRALGSHRAGAQARASYAAEQRRFFSPLLDARRQASASDPDAAVAAFDGKALRTSYRNILRQFAADRYAAPGASRRALEAELEDAAEPLFQALARLIQLTADDLRPAEDLRSWRAWTAHLRDTFEAADRVWRALGPALDAPVWPE